jgi:hypothetical protein
MPKSTKNVILSYRISGDAMRLCFECDQLLLVGSSHAAGATATATTSSPSSSALKTPTQSIVNDLEEEDPRHSLDSYMISSEENRTGAGGDSSDMAGLDTSLEHHVESTAFFMVECRGEDEEEEKLPVGKKRRTSKRPRPAPPPVTSPVLGQRLKSVFCCRVCAREYSTESALASHLFQDHAALGTDNSGGGELLQRFAMCPLDGCFKAFRRDSSAAMRNHLQRVHKAEPLKEAERSAVDRFECLECGKVFKNVYFLRKHTTGFL